MTKHVYHVDLCHAGNDRGGNAGLTPDVYDRPASDPLAVVAPIYFTCASEAVAPISFPCTGSKHPAAEVEVICICTCHVVATRFGTAPGRDEEQQHG